jgi:hypothetical protein
VIESPSFVEASRRQRRTYSASIHISGCHKPGGQILDELFADLKRRVSDLLSVWAAHGKFNLALDGWEIANWSHMVNYMSVSDGAAVFLDSIDVGAETQTANRPASTSLEVMAKHED